MKKKDLFISHASEDKDDFVRPLAELLIQYGLDVWYDEFELRIGSSLSRSIDKGIANSNFGLIVLSKSFFSKNWTEYELKSLNSYEIENSDILLPVWKDVTVKEVRDFSPYLADKFALTTKNSIEDIALKIIETCNPKLFSEIHYKIKLDKILKTAKVEKAMVSELKAAPIRHLKLNENLISRIRLIRSSLLL
ncbi:MAG: toll/interleukin-1 receptor domain-containing protein, partial [Gelidibacter sp.]